MNKMILLISFITVIIATILRRFENTLGSSLPRLFMVLMFYIVFVWIRITRWWNIAFDVVILGLLISVNIFYKDMSHDMLSKIFIVIISICGAYFLANIITVQMGFPIIKEKFDTNK